MKLADTLPQMRSLVAHNFTGSLALAYTIIGIPWGKQHFKMAGLSLAPFGKDVELGFYRDTDCADGVSAYESLETNSLKFMAITIDTTNLCSHLQKKLFEPEGVYYPIWQAIQNDDELTAVVRSRQLHIYRNGKKILILAGKAQPKIIREDKLNELIIK